MTLAEVKRRSHSRLSDIAVYEKHLEVALRKADRRIDGNKRFALARDGACKYKFLAFRLYRDIEQICLERAVRFDNGKGHIVVYYERAVKLCARTVVYFIIAFLKK